MKNSCMIALTLAQTQQRERLTITAIIGLARLNSITFYIFFSAFDDRELEAKSPIRATTA